MRAKQPTTQGTLDRDGVQLHYEVYGKGDHTILFLVPCWPVIHSRGYKAQIPFFSNHFRCITYGPRGNGQSDRPTDPEAYRFVDSVKDAIAVLDETKTEKAILVGLSASGPVCAALAAYYSDRVTAMITVGAASPFAASHEHRSVTDYFRKFDKFS